MELQTRLELDVKDAKNCEQPAPQIKNGDHCYAPLDALTKMIYTKREPIRT